jgi:hypothetical protein
VGAAIQAVRARDPATICRNDRLANGETNANAGFLGTEEGLEDVLDIRGGKARLIVKVRKDDPTILIEQSLCIDPACRLS